MGLARGALFGALGVAIVCCLAGVAGLDLGTAADQAVERPKKTAGPPPLVVDKDAPLLLDAGEKPAAKPTRAASENQACFVCHANYQEEPLAALHARKNIACSKCHGDSFPHRNDENNTTPPDVMYPLDAIVAACRECHKTHDAAPEEVVARWLERCPQKTDPKMLVCTDCHGRHRLKVRTVRWDKKTRKLIESKKDE
jgi:hypothetical protein